MKGLYHGSRFCARIFLDSSCRAVFYQPARTTFIVKRCYPVPVLHPWTSRTNKVVELEEKCSVYELVEDTNIRKQEPIKVILTAMVEGLGNKGDIMSVKPHFARQKLLLPGLAVYASPENIEEYARKKGSEPEEAPYSSPYVSATMRKLSQIVLALEMNSEQPWTIEPWHIRVAFRKAGFILPEESIELPSQPISGPDPSIQGKEFAAFVTINNRERVPVRLRIRHWSRIPQVDEEESKIPWHLLPAEPILIEQAELLESMPPIQSKNKTPRQP